MKRFILLLSFMLVLLPTAYARDYYGSIYINNKTGIPGTSWDYTSASSAHQAAYNTCVKKNKGRAGECVKSMGVVNGCVATAWSAKKQASNWSWGTSFSGVKNLAVQKCAKQANDCQLVSAFCTTVEYWY